MAFLGRISAFAQRMGAPAAVAGRRGKAGREGKPKLIAQRCIDESLALDFDEPELFRHWRARQVGRALVHFKNRAYRDAAAAALRARIPAARIPEAELSQQIEGALGELRARRKLLRRLYSK